MRNYLISIMILSVFLLGLSGCATKASKKEASMEERIQQLEQKDKDAEAQINAIRSEMVEDFGEVWQEMEAGRKEIASLKAKIDETLNDAVERAVGNRKLAVGKLLYEVTISDAAIPFAYDRSDLSMEARAALDAFAAMLIADNKVVYIEIQGHTDNIGSDGYNMALGRDRADSTLRYLHVTHGIPLNRMCTFSYGESKPMVQNDTEQNRARNRRVVLLVME